MGVYYSDRVVYSPDVTVFKENTKNPVYTDAWFQVDVLTCPAPNLNGITVPDYQKLKKVYKSRMRNILAIAQSRGIQALVLSDFGCGEYRNPPQLVAEAFAEELFQGDFRNAFQQVVFSIKTDCPQGKYNLQVFQTAISPWQKIPLYGKKISILVALGTYDYGHGVPVAPDEKTTVSEANYREYFKTSYQMMLWRLR